MDIFDGIIKDALSIVDKYGKKPINSVDKWGISTKNSFLLDKDTFSELGGYPKDSVNMLVESSNDFLDGIYIVGDESVITKKSHISFGKIVILKTDDETNDNIYDFSQKVLLCDSKCYFSDVMTRASSKHYYINYKVSNMAIKNGFKLSKVAKTLYDEFMKVDGVQKCAVILIIGDSPIYKELLPKAEKVKDITVTLNHIFDGINMDCGHCDMNEICDEVQGLRAIHKKNSQK